MLLRYLSIIIIALPLTMSAAIYKSIDKNGNLVFSDQPDKDATEVNLDTVQTYQQNKPTQKQDPKQTSSAEKKVKKVTEYTLLEIATPSNNSTFWVGGEPINVTVNLTPTLQADDEAVLFYDGNVQATVTGPAANVNFSITDYNTPGKHAISVSIRHSDQNGKVLKTSNKVTFYVLMQRNNQNG